MKHHDLRPCYRVYARYPSGWRPVSFRGQAHRPARGNLFATRAAAVDGATRFRAELAALRARLRTVELPDLRLRVRRVEVHA